MRGQPVNHPLIQARPATARTKVTVLKRPDPDSKHILGLGMPAFPDQKTLRAQAGIGVGAPIDMAKVRAAESTRTGFGNAVDMIKDAVNCPIYNMPVIEQVRWGMDGPQTDLSVKKNFGAEIDLFGSDKGAEGIDYIETTMAQPGETQTHMITCAIGFHIEPEPLCWTVKGNAWTHPTAGSVQPPSPDVFTQNDRFNGALGAAISGSSPTQVFLPSVLEWGWWANYVAWHMVRGYNLRWRIGQHTNIMDEVLRHTAYMPPNAQEGSASNSEVDVVEFIRRLNNRYESLGSALDFLKVNRLRIGSVTSGGSNVGIFAPSRDEELVGATYGGMDLRSMLRGNSEFRKLAIPYVIKAGVPIGLFAQECDTDQADTMREYLSITQGFGGAIPPLVTDANNINAVPDGTGAGVVALERTLDTSPANVPQQVDAERAIFKGGALKITLAVKGFEVTDDWFTVLQNNPDLRDVIMCECGCRWPA